MNPLRQIRRASLLFLAALFLAACSDTAGNGAVKTSVGGAGTSSIGGGAAAGGALVAGDLTAGGAATAAYGSLSTSGTARAGGGNTTGSGGSGSGGRGDTTTGSCAPDVWSTLEECGFPGPRNTGPNPASCPGGTLIEMGSSSMPTIELDTDGTVVECVDLRGRLRVTAKNVVIRNSRVTYDSGKKGGSANATAAIFLEDGASARVERVEIDGLEGSHACIWHQGTSLAVRYVNCHGVDDGIFTWASSDTAGDEFTIEDSYFHDLTPLTANGHMDGFQTEGAKNGVIRHNTYDMSADGTSAIAIWNSLKSSSNLLIEGNLIAGGAAAIYAEDYDPSEQNPEGGNTVSAVRFVGNKFSTRVSPCVGKYFVWFSRPQLLYGGGPTDGWNRSGNVVLETNESVDDGNPHVNGQLCN
jgi:Right handed beta helix region